MIIEPEGDSDLAKAIQGRYEGDDTNLKRISNEVKARRGEYEGFGTYLRQVSNKVKSRRSDHIKKPFPTSIIAASAVSLAVAGIGLFVYFGKAEKSRLTKA